MNDKNRSSKNRSSSRPPARKHQRVRDVSPILLWDDAESTSFTVDELFEAGERAAPFARARRIQATFAGAEAGGMSEATRLRVLADWAMVAGKYAPAPALSAAIELAVVASEQGPTPEGWQAFEQLEAEHVRRAEGSAPDAAAVLHMALSAFIDGGTLSPPAPPGYPTSIGEAAWHYAVNMLAAVAEAAGDDALPALIECDAVMSRRIFIWHGVRS